MMETMNPSYGVGAFTAWNGKGNNMRSEMQNEVEKLQEQVRRLEIQMAELSHADMGNIAQDTKTSEPPHPAIGKCQLCKRCSHVRMPHKSNPHYSCGARHTNVEPSWTCELYSFPS